MSINPVRLRLFADTYHSSLEEAVRQYPEDYPWHKTKPVKMVVESMVLAVERGSYNKDGRAMKNTFKKLGLAYTYKALDSWLRTAD